LKQLSHAPTNISWTNQATSPNGLLNVRYRVPNEAGFLMRGRRRKADSRVLLSSASQAASRAHLLAEGPKGKRVIELAGPREYSPRDVAEALGSVVGRPILAQQHADESMAAALSGTGINAEWARLFQELTQGINTGRVSWEGGGYPIWRGETDIQAVLAKFVGK
jgi:uncharacterized protein YbjT (DUF2867 family)